MCFHRMKIKSYNPSAPKFGFVPCGKCEECRKANKNAWAFRLSVELENCRKLGWRVGFCTLTYSDSSLPHLPKSLWRDCTKYKSVPCFSKNDVRRFVLGIRKELWKKYRITAIKYMICSEYGSNTQRPHYHAIFSWNGSLSAEEFHKIICKHWLLGFVFPRTPLGGYDSHGYYHKPFEVDGSARLAAKYAAKYCCKDISFMNIVPYGDIDTKCPLWRNCDCFHVQSRSLGFCAIKDLSDEKKLDLYINGYGFIGEDELFQLPTYLKNKIVFDNYYVVDSNGKRLCRRRANKFFHENAEAIFEKKRKFYENLISQICTEQFWLDRGLDVARTREFCDIARYGMNGFASSSSDCAAAFLAYYGVDFKRSLDLAPFAQWLNRYDDAVFLEEIPTIGFREWYLIKMYFDFVFSAVAMVSNNSDLKVKPEDLVSDYWKSFDSVKP